MSVCRHKMGFLSLRSCGIRAANQCGMCNRPICDKHSHPHEGNTVCPECYVEKGPEESEGQAGMDSEYRRRRIYHETGYYGYYGSTYMYDDHDYETFDRGADYSVDEREEIEADDFQDS